MLRIARPAVLLLLLCCALESSGQRGLTDMMDTTTELGRGMLSLYQRFNQLRLSCYIQPQFQYAGKEGARGFAGGDFSPRTDNRFMLRRARLRTDFVRMSEKGPFPKVQFVFQFDVNERALTVRDVWGRIFENKLNMFSVFAGVFARPFGYEVLLSSSDRETPERGRMSQILMRSERDLGAMLVLEPRAKGPHWLRFDIGLFNGQGIQGTADYDGHKDIIGRLFCKQYILPKIKWQISGGISGFHGAIMSQGNVRYKEGETGGMPGMIRDSAASNNGYLAPRHYAGADLQLKIPNKHGVTEFRAEYIRGLQTGTSATSETPGSYPVTGNVPTPLYTRAFDGAYFYFLQHLGSTKHQLVVKYDWYDANRKAETAELTSAAGFTAADIRYNTLGAGYNYYINPNVKMMLYYDHVMNESTGLTGFEKDLEDDVLTVRMQFRF